MGVYTPLILAFLELTFVTVAILLLHSLKHAIGEAAFYLSLGMFLVFGQIVSSAGLMIDPGIADLQVNMGSAVLLAPYMTALLVVYVLDGTLAAQRLIQGFAALVFGYFYLAYITATQCSSGEYGAADAETLRYIGRIFLQGRRVVVASSAAQALDLFVVPILFQFFTNTRARLFLCVAGTLVFAQVIDTFTFHLITTWGTDVDWAQALRTTYLARAAAMVWLAVLTTFYLRLSNVHRGPSRRPLDIVVAFFGGYGQAQQLRKHIREWEGRYQVVVEHSSDLILILDRDGRVLNANQAAVDVLGYEESRLRGFYLPGAMTLPGGEVCPWIELWDRIHPPPSRTAATVVPQEWTATTPGGKSVLLDVRVSGAVLHGEPVALVMARDVTERRRLEGERRRLEEQLIHTQRLEAVGLLAGGVAHDFNNLLHTIVGSAERLGRQKGLTEQQRALLGNISTAADRASALTSQLLGFARKGKYQTQRLNVADLLARVKALFEPVAEAPLHFRVITAPTPMFITGDSTQLQQVLLNILLNARDALAESETPSPKVVLRAEPGSDRLPGWSLRPDKKTRPKQTVCIRIKDNGPGIPEAIRTRIFEPFFTTKETGKGTGMGLAMAYGCITNHGGWIHVETRQGRGTEFFIFLPRVA